MNLQSLMNDEKHYITINNYLKAYYQTKIYKISLNGGFTCPNRDGTISKSGCLFCSEKGSGDFAGNPDEPLKNQWETIKQLMKEKWHDGKYIAYLQANSNTYAPIEKLEAIYSEIINLDKDIVIFDIATRPDCIDEKIVQLLAKINQKVRVWVELGFQTSNEKTATIINRGYQNQIFEKAIHLLNEYHIETIVHIINGLPDETENDMLNTIKYLRTFPISGIKIHMLHVMKQTPLAKIYLEHPFPILSLEEYRDIVIKQLAMLPLSVIIHRITGDSPKELLIEPKWTLKKFVVMNEIDKEMRKKGIYQGDLFKDDTDGITK